MAQAASRFEMGLLYAAGILQGQDATTLWAWAGELERRGAATPSNGWWKREKVITAAGVSAGIDMALVLAARVAGDGVAQAIQLGIEYDPQPPFDAGSPRTAPRAAVEALRARSRFA